MVILQETALRFSTEITPWFTFWRASKNIPRNLIRDSVRDYFFNVFCWMFFVNPLDFFSWFNFGIFPMVFLLNFSWNSFKHSSRNDSSKLFPQHLQKFRIFYGPGIPQNGISKTSLESPPGNISDIAINNSVLDSL